MIEGHPLEDTQPASAYRAPSNEETQPAYARRPRRCSCGCWAVGLTFGVVLGLIVTASLLFPSRTNILVLGVDRTPPGTAIGRSDAMILATVQPFKPYVGMLSIPRDLWVHVPGVGESRINTAHFFSESEQPGMGPAAAVETVQTNFGVDIRYFLRIQFDGLQTLVDGLGGIPIELEQPTAVLSAGSHLMDGKTALAFIRDRRGSDDFSRMRRGQLFIKAVLNRVQDPHVWPRLPVVLMTLTAAMDTNIPPWEWPSLGLALLRVGPGGIDARIIGREMVRGFTTQQGAQVLAPDWSMINPVLFEIFGQ